MVSAVIVMITLIGLGFVQRIATEHKAVTVHGGELQRAALVESGAELLSVLAEQPPAARLAAGGLEDNPALFRAVTVFDDPASGLHGRVTVLAPHAENDAVVRLGYGAENESARLNLAVLLDWDQKSPGAASRALMALPGMTESIAAAILDWIDGDDEQRPFGAEADYYAGLSLPYGPRNGIPANIEELLLVRGVSRAMLLGPDLNANYQIDANEMAGGGAAGASLPWAALLTVYSGERNVAEDGTPRIDLNHKDLRQLHQRLSRVLDPRWADFIVLYRQFGPCTDEMLAKAEADLQKAQEAAALAQNAAAQAPEILMPFGPSPGPGAPPEQQGQAFLPGDMAAADVAQALAAPPSGSSIPSHPAQIESVLDLIGKKVLIPTPPGQPLQVVESPFTADHSTMREYLPALLNQTTTTAEKVLPGRINLNLASRAVLLAVPGIDAQLVERIVAGRHTTADDPQRRHPAWPLAEGLCEIDEMKALLPYLTAGGDVYRAQVVGFFEEGGAVARAEVVIDATTSPSRQAYRKDLRLAGQGYSWETLAGH